MKIRFPDKSEKEYKKGITGLEIAKEISEGLGRLAVGIKANDEIIDLTTPIEKDSEIKIFTFKNPEGVEIFRHSTAHILAAAVLKLYPNALPTIGPAVEEGFYYDFDMDPINPEDMQKIETEMDKIIDAKIPFEREEVTKKEALKLFKNNPYKTEMIKEMEGKITVYKMGEFVDLCRGPHVPDTGKIKAVKLTKIAGAYWRGDAKKKQLQRIYGISYPDKKELKDYLTLIEEAAKRDHRKIGQDLDLIYFHEFSPGAPFYLKKGAIIYNVLIDFIRSEYRKRGYEEVITPQLYNKKLWEISGHWEHYKENMFIINVEGQEHSLKPMNCPSHCLIYNRGVKSYKDLPVRIADFCNLHRNELSGTLSGLFRVRKFAQDDGHIFCTFDQIEEEVLGVLDFIKYVWEQVFNFKLHYFLSTMPEKALGTKETWDKAESLLANALKKSNIKYDIKPGEGAFYGPKIDIDVEDALGRKWQCPTCQLDFNLPERFNTLYEGADGKKHRAVMIHRAVLGSLERFMGMMIEHYAGKFPLWLSPEQVRILTIADRHNDYAQEIRKKYSESGIRAAVDDRALTMQNKVRQAELDHINYILVVGDKERVNSTVNVRTRDNEIKGEIKVDDFLNQLKKEIHEKK
jgi:threonyl-tRNA synthetase